MNDTSLEKPVANRKALIDPWPRWQGGPTLNSTVSAVDIALWNFVGNILSGLHVNASTTNCIIHEFNQARQYAPWEEELYCDVHIDDANGYTLARRPQIGNRYQ